MHRWVGNHTKKHWFCKTNCVLFQARTKHVCLFKTGPCGCQPRCTDDITKSDGDGHDPSHDIVLGGAALSLSFVNPDQISFAAYVQKLSLGQTLRAIGVQKDGQYRSLYSLVEPVMPSQLMSDKNGFTDARISYSLLGAAVGTTYIPAGFAISGGMALQLGDAYLRTPR